MKLSLRELSKELDSLYRVDSDPRVRAAQDLVRKERAPKIAELKEQMEALREKRPEPKPRWADNVPAKVIEFCKEYWSGTTEYSVFRIHCWNDKAVCTSYPAGGYSTNGGWNKTQATFYFLSLTEKEYGRSKQIGKTLEGRQSKKQLETALAEITK